MSKGETAMEDTAPARTPARTKAQQLARHLRTEHPDYVYLKNTVIASRRLDRRGRAGTHGL